MYLYFQVIDLKTGQVCKPGVEGEICFKSRSMMRRYLNRPKETAEFFDADGFGRSGDIGYYTKSGRMFYTDRLKELIK